MSYNSTSIQLYTTVADPQCFLLCKANYFNVFIVVRHLFLLFGNLDFVVLHVLGLIEFAACKKTKSRTLSDVFTKLPKHSVT